MQHNDQQLGKPQVLYKGTYAEIMALTDVPSGALAYITSLIDIGYPYPALAYYTGSAWEIIHVPNYFRLDQNNTVSGQTTFNALSPGSPPFLLNDAATGLVQYLDADKLDGQHGSYYTPELGGMSYANRLRSGYSATDDFITAPTYNWAGSPFYTPDWYDTLYSRLRFRPPQNQRSMFVLPLSTQLMVYSGYNGNTVGDYWGIRFDDGTDNNYAELVFYIAQTNPFLWDIRLRWVIGGGAMNSTTIVQSINVPPTQIIHIYRDGSDWSSWVCRPTIRMPWGITNIVGSATSTLTWTPTRAGLLCKTSQTWPITEIDWYYRAN
ncbi:hypothetical protein C4588_04240 [Candidatus Parcubacteria bacterium]|nr:MAG: hypothetical protein C4588_04240 [Candidatus Parcubacteria bacterium]